MYLKMSDSKITRNSILQRLKGEAGLADNDSRNLLANFFTAIHEEVNKGTNVKLHGFGSFRKKTAASRNIKDFQTGETKLVSGKTKIKFKKSVKKA